MVSCSELSREEALAGLSEEDLVFVAQVEDSTAKGTIDGRSFTVKFTNYGTSLTFRIVLYSVSASFVSESSYDGSNSEYKITKGITADGYDYSTGKIIEINIGEIESDGEVYDGTFGLKGQDEEIYYFNFQ